MNAGSPDTGNRYPYKRRTYRRIVVYSLAVSFVGLAASTLLLSGNYERLATAGIHQTSVEMLEQTNAIFGAIHSWLVPTFLHIGSEPDVAGLITHGREFTFPRLVQAYNRLNDAMSHYPMLHSIYVYNERQDAFFSTVMGFEGSDVSDIELRWFLESHRDRGELAYIPRTMIVRMPRLGANGSSRVAVENVFSLIVPAYGFSQSESASCMVVNISERKLRASFASHTLDRRSRLIIVDDQGRVLSHPDPAMFDIDLSDDSLIARVLQSTDVNGTFRYAGEEETMLVTFVRNPEMGWRFVTLTPYADVFAALSRNRWISLLVFVLLLAVVVVLTVVLSNRLYSPIAQLSLSAERLETEIIGDAGRSRPTASEIQYLGVVLKEAADRVGGLQSYIDDHETLYRRELLRSLLDGSVHDGDLETDPFYRRLAKHSRFIVAVASVDRTPGAVSTGGETLALTERLLGSGEDRHVCDMGGGRLGTIVVDDGPDAVRHELRRAQAAVRSSLGLSMTVGVSAPVLCLRDIHDAFRKANAAVLYRFRSDGGALFTYEEMAVAEEAYAFPEREAQLLLNDLKLGKMGGVRQRLEVVLDSVREHGHGDFVFMVQMMKYMTAKAVAGPVSDIDPESARCVEMLDRLDGAQTIREVRSVLTEAFDAFSRVHADARFQRKRDIAVGAKSIIQRDIASLSLCPDGIADELSLSTNYLRRVFQEIEHQSVSSYILAERLERCKELLGSTDRSVKEIAAACGFASYTHFFTSFKREVGETPLQYRQHVGSVVGRDQESKSE